MAASRPNRDEGLKHRVLLELATDYAQDAQVHHRLLEELGSGSGYYYIYELVECAARNSEAYLEPIVLQLKESSPSLLTKRWLLAAVARMGEPARKAIPELLEIQSRQGTNDGGQELVRICLLTLGHTNALGWRGMKSVLERDDPLTWRIWLTMAVMRSGRTSTPDLLQYCQDQVDANSKHSYFGALLLANHSQPASMQIQSLSRAFETALRSTNYTEKPKCIPYGLALATMDPLNAKRYYREIFRYLGSEVREGFIDATFALFSVSSVGADLKVIGEVMDSADERELIGACAVAGCLGYGGKPLLPRFLQIMSTSRNQRLRSEIAQTLGQICPADSIEKVKTLLAREDSLSVRADLLRSIRLIDCQHVSEPK